MKRKELEYIQQQIDFQQISEIKIYYKSKGLKTHLTNSTDVYNVLMKWWDETINIVESFALLLLNRANNIIGIYKVSQGGINGTIIDKRLICAVSILSGASGIILCHNHPSGNLRPSDSDINLTINIKESLKLVDIELLDHIIITPNDGEYCSFTDQNLIP